MSGANGVYGELMSELREVKVFESVGRVLAWDQETMMPGKGAGLRADQLSMLAGMSHTRQTSARLGELIGACEGDGSVKGDERASANVREARRDYDKATKLPKDLVEEMARASSLGMDAWKQARKDNDFKAFLPWLQKTVELNRRKAECLGIPEGANELYDALMDLYEPYMTAERTAATFAPLREFTVGLLDRVRSSAEPDVSIGTHEFPLAKQHEFVKRITEAVGYDYGAGRMDDSAHPFCEGVGPGDVRITNRYRADGWLDSLSSGLHEAGHAMYEQGLPAEAFGGPLGEAVSLGIHESQSRMWENLVGRSLPFWEWAIDIAREVLGGPLESATPEQVFKAANVVRPSFIRVEADEVTYNLHIMLRFDLERAMIGGELDPKDLPGVWNERMKGDFGLTVPEDRVGCLQDVHWSMGAMGYFPTYSFGNIYASQLWEAMGEALPGRDEQVRRGEFGAVLGWLREHVHGHGRRWPAEELCKRASGKGLEADALMRHLEGKVGAVYEI